MHQVSQSDWTVHSFSRAAFATLTVFEDNKVMKRNRERAAQLMAALPSLREHGRMKHFRRQGMIWPSNADISQKAAAGFPRYFSTRALRHELPVCPICRTIYSMLPYILDPQDGAPLGVRLLDEFRGVEEV